MNPTDPAADPFDVRNLTPEMVERLPKDPALFQRIVSDLLVLAHEGRQELQQLQRLEDLLKRLLPPGSSALRKKKRRRH